MKNRFNFKAYIRAFCLSIFFLNIAFSANASHLAAADIHVDYIGTGPTDYTYRITLRVYRSCEPTSITLSDIARLTWGSSCYPTLSDTMGVPFKDTLDQLCDTFKDLNACRNIANASIFPAFNRHTWTKVITLPGPCTDWLFSWTDGTRNAAIKNLVTPDSRNIYVDAMINNSKKASVNSPRYTVDPIPYFCLNSKTSFPNAPYDPDLDSMVSVNAQPRTAFMGGIPYACPPTPPAPYPCYSLVNPIESDLLYPYIVDVNTGTATFQPTVAGKFVLAFQTFDYDRKTNELMGFTTRDVQVTVLGCPAPAPTNDSIPIINTGGYFDAANSTLFACPNQSLSFQLGSISNSLVNAIYTKWDLSLLPGATFTTVGDGTKRSVGTFNWTPTKADIGDHILALRFVDSTCSTAQPIVTENIYVLKITVLPAVDAGADGIYCIPGGAAYQMETVLEKGMRYKWSSIFGSGTLPPFMDDDTLARPRVKPNVLTRYMVEGSIYRGPYRCTTRDTVDVRIGVPLITIDAGPEQTICANTSISLKGTVSPSSALSYVSWTPSKSLDDTTKLNPIAKPYVSTYYVMYAQDINGCGFSDTTRVVVNGFQPILFPYASRDTVCPDGSTQLFSNVSQQPCGVAQSACTGGIPSDKTVGIGTIPSTTATPFYHSTSSGGERMQILYRRDELLDAGLKAGFINSMAFNIPAKNSTDSFYKFTIKMACTPDASLSGTAMSSFPGTEEVLPSQRYFTTLGWNTFIFPNAYYWDGSSNLVVEICWSKFAGTYGGTPDPVFSSNTGFTSVKYIPSYTLPAPAMGEGCSLAAGTPLLASTRPNTRFNVCITPSLFKYAWTPTSYLNQPDSANTNADGIKTDITYNIKVTAASNPNCFTNKTVPITIDRTNSVTIMPLSPYIFCRPGNFDQLSATGNGPRPLRNLDCGTSNPLTCATPSSSILANPSTGSINAEPFNHAFNGTYATAHTQYIIPRSVLVKSNVSSGTIRSIAFDAVSASSMNFSNLKISMKCTDTKQFSSASPVMFEPGATLVYTAPGATVINSGYGTVFTLDLPYNWDTTKNLLIDFCYAQATPSTGPTINSYSTPGFNYMIQSYQTSGDVCANPSSEIGPAVSEYLPNFQINYCPAGDTDFSFSWSLGDYFQDSLIANPIVYVDETSQFFVKTRGRNGCLVSDSLMVIIPENTRFITQDTTICLNESIQLRSYNGVNTKWYQETSTAKYDKAQTLSCDSCERAIAKPGAQTTYYAAVTSSDGCIDTFKTTVSVKPLPVVNIANRDTVIKYGKSVVLNAFGGRQYYWTPIAGVSNPNYVSPTVSPLITTTYKVVGVGENGCRNEDSVKITIDYKSKMSVPNVFSPNGDGKNDVFRLLGVTFQSLTEFKVFNRWGAEVYSTQNINDGWDGTYKGKPADMGVYNYIIRVAYPDGATDTFKGDVTLMR